jgi:erythromycin esterase-like protein
MTHTPHASVEDWIAREALACSLDSTASLNGVVDRVLASLGAGVELLGFGEALHGGEEILVLRNRLFQRLVEAHGYSAIAIESSFSRARVVNEFIAGRGPTSYEAIQETGFGPAFGKLEANRELVEWMRRYNADPTHPVKLQFYAFDIPTGAGFATPRHVLHFVLDYLETMDRPLAQERRQRIDTLIGADSDWENLAAMSDPTKAVGLSPQATSLRIETEDLINVLRTGGPEFTARSDALQFAEALHYAWVAQQLLNAHAALARKAGYVELLGIRDALMADNLMYVLAREQGRGKVLAFAHNSHLKRGQAQWQLGPDLHRWWPAGSHLHEMLGPRYAVIGSGVGVSEANGIGKPEVGTLEARLTAAPGPVRFIPTYRGQAVASSATANLPIRSGSQKNPTYFPLTPESFTDFEWLVVLDSATYQRGGPPLQEWEAK